MSGQAELWPRLQRALERRAALLRDSQTDVCRLVNGRCDGLEGLVLERYGGVLVAQVREGGAPAADELLRELCAKAAEQVGALAVYRKVFPKDRSAARPDLDAQHRDPAPWIGLPCPAVIEVRESGLVFRVRPYDGYATGLFLDHRLQRARVRELAPGRRVLNLFAYTCAFTVAAVRCGAVETVSVDISRRYLDWGRQNLVANDLPPEGHRFLTADVSDYLRRAARQGRRFGLVILDPPTFGRARRPRRTFSLRSDLGRLIGEAAAVIEPGGYLHLSVNHRHTSVEDLAGAVEGACRAGGRSCVWMEPPPVPEDFGADPEAAKCVVGRVG